MRRPTPIQIPTREGYMLKVTDREIYGGMMTIPYHFLGNMAGTAVVTSDTASLFHGLFTTGSALSYVTLVVVPTLGLAAALQVATGFYYSRRFQENLQKSIEIFNIKNARPQGFASPSPVSQWVGSHRLRMAAVAGSVVAGAFLGRYMASLNPQLEPSAPVTAEVSR